MRMVAMEITTPSIISNQLNNTGNSYYPQNPYFYFSPYPNHVIQDGRSFLFPNQNNGSGSPNPDGSGPPYPGGSPPDDGPHFPGRPGNGPPNPDGQGPGSNPPNPGRPGTPFPYYFGMPNQQKNDTNYNIKIISSFKNLPKFTSLAKPRLQQLRL